MDKGVVVPLDPDPWGLVFGKVPDLSSWVVGSDWGDR